MSESTSVSSSVVAAPEGLVTAQKHADDFLFKRLGYILLGGEPEVVLLKKHEKKESKG